MKTTTGTAQKKTPAQLMDWKKADDATIVAAILDRENLLRSDRAWHELIARYDATINKRVRRVVGNCARQFRASDTFDEIKSEFFAALLTNDVGRLRGFDPAKGTLATWLSMIANQVAITYLTKLVRDPSPDPFEAIDADEVDAGYGEEDRDSAGNGQIGARWVGGASQSSPHRLLMAIESAKLAVVDEKRRLVFAWYGATEVRVYDEDGDLVHYFKVNDATEDKVRAAIERTRKSGKLDQ